VYFNVRLDRRSLLRATVRVSGSLDVVFAFQLPSRCTRDTLVDVGGRSSANLLFTSPFDGVSVASPRQPTSVAKAMPAAISSQRLQSGIGDSSVSTTIHEDGWHGDRMLTLTSTTDAVRIRITTSPSRTCSSCRMDAGSR